MKKIAVIIPYFGKLPNYFDLWLEGARLNNSIDFLVYTDDKTVYQYPHNVKVNYLSFSQMKEKIQSKYSFEISLNSPYKICDFRPAYGDIFSEDLQSYDFFGYCDLDTIFGDIRKFITDDILESHDKIFQRGHLCFIKNNEECRQLYKKDYKGEVLFEKVFSNPQNRTFDEKFDKEEGGVNGIFLQHGKKLYINNSILADINVERKSFFVNSDQSKRQRSVFVKNQEGLFRYSLIKNQIVKQEYSYIHLQKRKMLNQTACKTNFLIVPNAFIEENQKIDRAFIKRSSKEPLLNTVILKNRFFSLAAKIKRVFK